ncbi:MAG: RsmG family class I SAM-dependent methyltransferase, partial [Jatrophihabitantaceae bacterium]
WVTARAVAPLERLSRWCLPLLKPGGRLLAIKGVSAQDELTRDATAINRAGGRHPQVIACGSEFGLAVPVVSIERAKSSSRKRGT